LYFKAITTKTHKNGKIGKKKKPRKKEKSQNKKLLLTFCV